MTLPIEARSSAPAETIAGDGRHPKNIGDLHKTITMAQIAKAAGVSQGAISSLLNDRDYGIQVSEKTRERVFKVCREMGYIPNDLRAVVRMYPELGDTCLLISTRFPGGLAHPFINRIAAATISGVSAMSRALTVSFYDESRDYSADAEAMPHPIRCGVCSKYLLLGEPNASLLLALQRRGLPAVSLGAEASHPGVLSLVPDYEQASQTAVEHLFELGHRQIAIVSGPFGAADPQIITLNRGVRLACDRLGIELDAQHIVHGDLTAQAGWSALEEMLARQPAPTAVLCLSDTAATGLLAAAQARGMNVPAQLSLIGCGDDVSARSVQPALTTLHVPAEEMAAQGLIEIERLIHEPVISESRKITVPVPLVQRDSTATLLQSV